MKKNLEKADVEVIRFNGKDDIVTDSIHVGGQGGNGFQPGPSIPFGNNTGDAGVGSGTDNSGD